MRFHPNWKTKTCAGSILQQTLAWQRGALSLNSRTSLHCSHQTMASKKQQRDFDWITYGYILKYWYPLCSYSMMSLSLKIIYWHEFEPISYHQIIMTPRGPSSFQIETPWGGMPPPQHIPFMRGVLMTLRPVMVRPLGSLGYNNIYIYNYPLVI